MLFPLLATRPGNCRPDRMGPLMPERQPAAILFLSVVGCQGVGLPTGDGGRKSSGGGVERLLQALEDAHDAQAGEAVGAGSLPGAEAVDEVLALEPQGL